MELAPRHQRLGPRLRAAGIIGSGASFQVGEEFFQNLDAALRPNGFRPDIRVHANRAHRREDVPHTCIDVQYNPQIGVPSPQDLQAAVEHALPGKEADITMTAITDQHHGWLSVPIRHPEDRIVIASASRLPEGFHHVAGGIYCKADAPPGVRWQLERDAESGALALVRVEDEPSMGDFERQAVAIQSRPVVGDAVVTPDGRGILVARSANGEPVVEISGQRFSYHHAQVQRVEVGDPGSAPSFKPGEYDGARERAYQRRFYKEVYGDDKFADGLTRDFGGAGG